MLDSIIAETVKKFPNGDLPPEQKLKVLKSVPVFAAFKLGANGAEKENYRFRVFSNSPRKKENQSNSEEITIYNKFESNKAIEELTQKTEDGKNLAIYRPVRIASNQGCLSCHGHPNTSPWRNGKDVLGYEMENMKDGELRAIFAVVSSLAPVEAETKAATINIVLWGSLFTFLAVGIAFFIIRGPVGSIASVSGQISKSGEELTSASAQISSVSQSLSSNSTEAASSLEETVASVEELSSMVNKNAESAKEASVLSQACQSTAQKGEVEIKELISAIADISTSSKKIEEIINVIDDIAFQTNLLALNAAVEAARAGEQGKGFAVVAEAVRNLAQRSANAAKDISTLIRESVGKVERGSKIAGNSGTVLNEIVTSVRKVADINAEIASASSEQANGISQISKAMNQLDQVTQQNAAASEESAASAEELASQAKSLQDLVSQLYRVLEGTTDSQQVHHQYYNDNGNNSNGQGGNYRPTTTSTYKTQQTKLRSIQGGRVRKTAAEMIPLDEQELGKVGTTDGF